MTKPVRKADTGLTHVAAAQGSAFDGLGHRDWSIQAKFDTAGGAPAATCRLQGSNDGTAWNTIATATATGAGTFFGEAAGKSYRFYRWNLDAIADLRMTEVHIHGSGNAATV